MDREERNENKRKHYRGPGKRRRKKKNGKRVDIVSTIVLIVAVCVFIFSAYQLVNMLLPYYFGGQEYDKIKNLAVVQDEGKDDKSDQPFRINFGALIEENPDTVAWIHFVEPSIISYPVVKSKDNEEYLTKTFSANDNKLGAIFMDMNNSGTFTDRNTMIYGHNMRVGGEMFSQLNKYAEQSFCQQYPYFYIYTPDGKVSTYQIFSAGVVSDTAENYNLSYASDEEFLKYLELCKQTSNYNVDVELNAQSKIVSLSTCTNINQEERFLVQGVLIKQEDQNAQKTEDESEK